MTLRLFRQFKKLVLYADDERTNLKHCPFSTYESTVAGKILALNIRRLPSWMLSFAQHQSRYGTYPEYKPVPMLSSDKLVVSTEPDRYLNQFLCGGKFQVSRWLRTEHLTADFIEFISEFCEVPWYKRWRMQTLGRVNEMSYDHNLDNWFSKSQIKQMYRNNPIWAEVECRVFGSLT